MKHQSYCVIRSRSLIVVAVMILCACSSVVRAQWTQPDGNGHINSTNTGNVGIGTTAPAAKLTISTNTQSAPAGQPGTGLQIVGANGTSSRLLIDSFGVAISSIDMRRSNNTASSPTALGNGDLIGQITWQGYGATAYHPASRAKIMVGAAEAYTDTAQGAFMTFSVAPRGAITSVEAMRIDATGFIGLGTPAPAYRLDVQGGSINSSGGLCIAGICKSDWSQVGNSQWANGSGFINYSSGYVGIGTPTPSSLYKLDVQGGLINSAGGLCIAGDCKTAWSQVTGSQQWTPGSSSSIFYNTGNVGIGTTGAPTRKLQVVGGNVLHQWNTASGTEFGFYTAINNNHFSSNLYFDGLWKMIGPGKGAVITTGPANGNAFAVYADNNTRAANDTAFLTQSFAVTMAGDVGVGTSTPSEKLEVNGNLKLTGTGNITAAGTIDAFNIKAKYQDLAEWVESSQELAGGTVVILDSSKSNSVIASTGAYDSRVAGVISLQPGIALGEPAEGRVLVATTGRVKVKVDASNGPINIGDLLVTSDKTGAAMKSMPLEIGGVRIHRPGTLIGKALEPLAQGTGEILVLLSLQ